MCLSGCPAKSRLLRTRIHGAPDAGTFGDWAKRTGQGLAEDPDLFANSFGWFNLKVGKFQPSVSTGPKICRRAPPSSSAVPARNHPPARRCPGKRKPSSVPDCAATMSEQPVRKSAMRWFPMAFGHSGTPNGPQPSTQGPRSVTGTLVLNLVSAPHASSKPRLRLDWPTKPEAYCSQQTTSYAEQDADKYGLTPE